MDSRHLQAGDRMRRQLVKQHKQQEQEQQQRGNRSEHVSRDLPAKQDQTHHNPVTANPQRGAFTSDQ